MKNEPAGPQRNPLSLALALAMSLAAFGSIAGIVAMEFAGCSFLLDRTSPTPAEVYGSLASMFWGAGLSILGLLVIFYRPANRIGWLTLCIGLFGTLNFSMIAFRNCSSDGILAPLDSSLLQTLINLDGLLLLVSFGFFLMMFPDGKFNSVHWQRTSIVLVIAAFIYFPFGNNAEPTAFALPIFTIPLLGIVSLVLRWRKSSGDIRQQIKWLTFFLATFFTLFLAVEIIGYLYFPAIFEGWFYLGVVTVFFVGFPIALGISIFKYRLYDIDIIIRRTISYALLTAVLAVSYYGGVVLLQTLFRGVSGSPDSPLIVVLSTLAIAAMFNPLRLRIQEIFDRRFYRTRYDSAKTLQEFAATARNEVDLDRLSHTLVEAVEGTLQPESTSLWLKR